MKVTRAEFDTLTAAHLRRLHSRAEVIAALDSFGSKPPSKKRRTPLNVGSLVAIWVAVEISCEKMKRRSVKAACEQLANDIKAAGVGPAGITNNGDVTANEPVGADQIRALHGRAASIGKRDAAFKKMLADKMAEQRNNLGPGDVLVPVIFAGGADLPAWIAMSDRPEPGSLDREDPRFADGIDIDIQPEKSC